MARREIVVLEDDLDGGDADETVKFSVDGVHYEIDLSSANAAKLRESFAEYVAKARKPARSGVVAGRSVARTRSAAADRDQNRAIREWAKKKGKAVSGRGRLSQGLIDEYNASAGR